MFSRLLTPKWLLLHLLVAVLFVATFVLGYWQLTKAEVPPAVPARPAARARRLESGPCTPGC